MYDELSREYPHTRYHRDTVFKALVDTLYFHMGDAKYTPTELREACHLAACMYEDRHVRPFLIDPAKPFIWNVKA